MDFAVGHVHKRREVTRGIQAGMERGYLLSRAELNHGNAASKAKVDSCCVNQVEPSAE